MRKVSTAISIAKPGDTIYIRGGTYFWHETLINNKNGNCLNWLIISAYPGEVVYIDGANIGSNAFHITGSSYIILQNLSIQHFTGAGVWVNGSQSPCDNIILFNLDISNLDPLTKYSGATMGILGDGDATHVMVNSCKIHHIGTKYWKTRQLDQGIYLNNGVSNWSIINNIINDVDDNGIQIRGDPPYYNGAMNSVIRKNYICGAKQHGGLLIGDNSFNILVHGNYFHNNQGFDLALWNQFNKSNIDHKIKDNYFTSNNTHAHLEFWNIEIGHNFFCGNTYYFANIPLSYLVGTNDYPETYLNFSQWQAKGQDVTGCQFR